MVKTTANDPYRIKARCVALGITQGELANEIKARRGTCNRANLSKAMGEENKTPGQVEMLQMADSILSEKEKEQWQTLRKAMQGK
jgi:hypothetical protein